MSEEPQQQIDKLLLAQHHLQLVEEYIADLKQTVAELMNFFYPAPAKVEETELEDDEPITPEEHEELDQDLTDPLEEAVEEAIIQAEAEAVEEASEEEEESPPVQVDMSKYD